MGMEEWEESLREMSVEVISCREKIKDLSEKIADLPEGFRDSITARIITVSKELGNLQSTISSISNDL